MGNNARRIVRKQLQDNDRLVTRGQLKNLLAALDAEFNKIHAVLNAEQNRPWWRRFLGLRG